ncbi:MAG: phosphopyruvate hydratase [Saprospiraceae bacterium]|nr:phosphopyruvate hydratase [Saprospiraceae bacterium]
MVEKIKAIDAYTVFDSRGFPTIECLMYLDGGHQGRAMVPSGASTGTFEALELRDRDPSKFGGKSVYQAIRNIKEVIQPVLLRNEVKSQHELDDLLIELDGTENKSRLGANAILAVSMAYASSIASYRGLSLFESLPAKRDNYILPLPEIQIFGGGAHSAGRIDIQDFMIICNGAGTLMECYEMTFKVYQEAGKILKRENRLAGLADEGGYWPVFDSNEAVFQILTEAILQAGLTPGREVSISLDIAASEFYDKNQYHLKLDNRVLSSHEFSALLGSWLEDYAICSIEDPFSEHDISSWRQFTSAWSDKIQIIGDDLFVTHRKRLENGIRDRLANSILIKLNQIGTVSETLACIEDAINAGWRPVISARSGETEDTFISHLAVATGAGQLKVGSFARSERMAKWNELLRIERKLSDQAKFANDYIQFPWQ